VLSSSRDVSPQAEEASIVGDVLMSAVKKYYIGFREIM
jgi:hypothetical protein